MSFSTEIIFDPTTFRSEAYATEHESREFGQCRIAAKRGRSPSCAAHPASSQQFIPNSSSGESLDRQKATDSFYSHFSTPQSPTLSFAGSKERLRNAAMRGPSDSEFPVVPTRPLLRPTLSSDSTTSKFSMGSTESGDLKWKSEIIVEVHELQQHHDEPRSDRSRIFPSIAILFLLSFLCGANVTSLATALPSLAYDLNITSVQAFWVVNSYLLTSALFQPLGMRLSSVAGCKPMLLFGLLLWLAGSIASALGSGLFILLAGRIISGVGAGAVVALNQLILHQLARPPHLAKWEQVLSFAFWLGAAIGPIVGGAISQSISWRYVFCINVPFCLLGLFCIPFVLQLPWRTPLVGLTKIDYSGWTLLTVATTGIVLAISWAGTAYAWTSWHTLLPFSASIIGLTSWILYTRCTRDSIIPITIFRSASASAVCFGTMVHGIAFTTVVYFMPFFLTLVSGFDSIDSSIALGIWTFSLTIMVIVGGCLTIRSGPRFSLLLGWSLLTMGVGLMLLFRESTAINTLLPVGLISSVALGLLVPSLSKAIQQSASDDDETIYAAPLHTFFNTLGQAIGIAIGSSVLLNGLSSWAGTRIMLLDHAHLYASNAVQMVHVIPEISFQQAHLTMELVANHTDALSWIWVVLCALSGAALMLSSRYTDHRRSGRRITFEMAPRVWEVI